MPKATIDENDESRPGEHKVRTPGHGLDVSLVVKPESTQRAVDSNLGPAIEGAYAGHAVAALSGGEAVGHAEVPQPSR